MPALTRRREPRVPSLERQRQCPLRSPGPSQLATAQLQTRSSFRNPSFESIFPKLTNAAPARSTSISMRPSMRVFRYRDAADNVATGGHPERFGLTKVELEV